MSQPEPFPQTTPPVESTPPTLNTSAPVKRHDGDPTLPAPPHEPAGERFEVLRFHARGGMGEVSVALDRELRREVAYKQIQPRFAADAESRRRFILEAEVTGRLEHPGIVPIYGLGVEGDGRPYYAMRFVQGDSLRDTIQAFHAADQPGRPAGERELALRGLLRRFVDVCNAVAFAHDRGWLHRDLKPANVMLGKFGETLVVDWGLARALRKEAGEVRAAQSEFPPLSLAAATQQTRQGEIVGTAPYMSAEQARGDWDAVGVRSDVYSLGAVLYELLTGKLPVEGTLSEVLEAIKAGRLVPVRQRKAGVPAALAAVVAKAMALRREERYETAQELAAEVERWLADEGVTAFREPLIHRVRRWGRRHQVLMTGLTVLLLTASVALGIGLVVVNQARRQAERAEHAAEQALAREMRERRDKEAALASVTIQAKSALDTVRSVVVKLATRLKPAPGTQEWRRELVTEAAEGLKRVYRVADTAVAIDREQVWVHFELGELFLQTGKDGLAQAQEQFQRGHELARRLAEAEPDNAQVQRDLCASLERLGQVRLRAGDVKAALELLQRSHALLCRLAEAEPKNAETERDLAVSHEHLGDVRLKQGDDKGALDAIQTSLKLRRRSVEADPMNVRAQRELSLSLHRLGAVQLKQGATQAALVAYQQSHEMLARLAKAEPTNPQTQGDLCEALNALGDVRLRLGDTKAALDFYQQSLEVARRLAESDPKNAQAQRSLSVSFLNVGDVRLDLGDTKAALDYYQKCFEVHSRLAENDPKDVETQRDLSVSLGRLGDVRLQRGETKGALEDFLKALAITRRLAAADPHNAQAQGDLSRSMNKVGRVRFELRDLKAALDVFQQSHKIAQRLAEADPKNAEAQRDLSVCLNWLGDVRRQLGEPQAALDAFQLSHTIANRLAQADPKNAEAQRDLSVSSSKLGDVRLQLGDTKAALDAYQKSLEIHRRLAEADPRNAQAQRGLLVGYFKLGGLHQTQHDFAAAIPFYEKALDVPRRFAQPEFFQNEVAILESLLRVCRAADKVLADPSTAEKLPIPLRLQVLSAILPPLAKQKQRDKLLLVGELLAKEEKNPAALYDAACAVALCVPLSEKADDKEKHAARAVALLRQAVAAGYQDRAHLEKDTDLAPLRQRADFQKVLQSLPAKAAP